ncbi:MAG: hypothetical protein JF618_02580 [Leifsonia sp.]|nr:hypothetical protein [Leifsonia sp.]
MSHRALGLDDTQSFAAVRVTTPLRTACDLLSVSTAFGDAEALEVRHLLALAAVTPAELDELLRASRRKGTSLARSRMPAVARAVLPLLPLCPVSPR